MLSSALWEVKRWSMILLLEIIKGLALRGGIVCIYAPDSAVSGGVGLPLTFLAISCERQASWSVATSSGFLPTSVRFLQWLSPNALVTCSTACSPVIAEVLCYCKQNDIHKWYVTELLSKILWRTASAFQKCVSSSKWERRIFLWILAQLREESTTSTWASWGQELAAFGVAATSVTGEQWPHGASKKVHNSMFFLPVMTQ